MVSRRRSRRSRRRRRRTKRTSFQKRVKKVLFKNTESRWYLTPLTTAFPSISSTWNYFQYQPAQGVDIATRVGRKIVITGFELRGVLQHGTSNIATDDKYNIVRIVSGVAPFESGVFTPLGSLGLSEPLVHDSNQGQLISRKLYDRVITLKSPGPDSVGYMPDLKSIRIKKRLNLTVHYASDATGYPDKIPFIAMKSDSVAAPSPGFVQGWIKIWWKDA